MKKIKNELKKIFNKDNINKKDEKLSYSLLDDAFSFEDIYAGIEVLMSKKITMGDLNRSRRDSLFVNASSRVSKSVSIVDNLLASFALTNPKKKNFLKRGDLNFLFQLYAGPLLFGRWLQAGFGPKIWVLLLPLKILIKI